MWHVWGVCVCVSLLTWRISSGAWFPVFGLNNSNLTYVQCHAKRRAIRPNNHLMHSVMLQEAELHVAAVWKDISDVLNQCNETRTQVAALQEDKRAFVASQQVSNVAHGGYHCTTYFVYIHNMQN